MPLTGFNAPGGTGGGGGNYVLGGMSETVSGIAGSIWETGKRIFGGIVVKTDYGEITLDEEGLNVLIDAKGKQVGYETRDGTKVYTVDLSTAQEEQVESVPLEQIEQAQRSGLLILALVVIVAYMAWG